MTRRLLVGIVFLAPVACGSGQTQPAASRPRPNNTTTTHIPHFSVPGSRRATVRRAKPHALGLHTVTLRVVDPSRTMSVLGHVVPRSFDVEVTYPAGARGRLPLIVFGHGYAVTPSTYSRLLRAWARAGYVVAAPVFPLENGNAPGGPNENDLVNQPADMSLVITRLHEGSSAPVARLGRLIDFRRIAVAGQSDGGDTALAAAYGPQRDPRITAAVILSGAEDPFAPQFVLSRRGPPLLAIQGTADPVNPAPLTYRFFALASPPKYLLKLIGAAHLPPYTEPGPELAEVEHTTLAFLDRYLKGQRGALKRYVRERAVGAGSELIADP